MMFNQAHLPLNCPFALSVLVFEFWPELLIWNQS
jgi:hypothetical protein